MAAMFSGTTPREVFQELKIRIQGLALGLDLDTEASPKIIMGYFRALSSGHNDLQGLWERIVPCNVVLPQELREIQQWRFSQLYHLEKKSVFVFTDFFAGPFLAGLENALMETPPEALEDVMEQLRLLSKTLVRTIECLPESYNPDISNEPLLVSFASSTTLSEGKESESKVEEVMSDKVKVEVVAKGDVVELDDVKPKVEVTELDDVKPKVEVTELDDVKPKVEVEVVAKGDVVSDASDVEHKVTGANIPQPRDKVGKVVKAKVHSDDESSDNESSRRPKQAKDC